VGFAHDPKRSIVVNPNGGIAVKRFMRRARRSVLLVALFTFSLIFPPSALAKSPVKMTKFEGAIDLSAEGPIPFVLSGEASHLGKFRSYGEVVFEPGEEPGTLVGRGPVVLEAANGDLLVGVVIWKVSARDGDFRAADMHFSWRDEVQFSDTTIVANTGRFVDDRPPGLVVAAIIGLLIDVLVRR
jgi:hypothetical protein